MKKLFRHYFIPHEHNNFQPHILREKSFVAIVFLILLLVSISWLSSLIVLEGSFLTAVLPGVLTDFANQDRYSGNLGALKISMVLEKAAKLKAEDMASKSYFAHVSPDGKNPWHWFNEAGYKFIYAGENLAIDFSDSSGVHRAWMNSAGHRANILNGNFTEIGIAVAKGMYQGRETIFVVEMFGRPSLAEKIVLNPKPHSVSKTLEPKTKAAVLNEMFVAVENLEAEELQKTLDGVSEEKVEKYSSLPAQAIASPKNTINFVYIFLSAIIFSVLSLNVFIEIKRQHPKHIAYGVLMLVFIAAAFYLNQSIIFPAPLVV